jgi:hypothetical protein
LRLGTQLGLCVVVLRVLGDADFFLVNPDSDDFFEEVRVGACVFRNDL